MSTHAVIPNVRIISAGAGSGKTFRLTNDMVEEMEKGVRPSGIIATTFTKKAAEELKERVRLKLLENGQNQNANELSNALIGTVHSIGGRLLQRFAFEAGVSPQVTIIADEDQNTLFNLSLTSILLPDLTAKMDTLTSKLGMHKREYFDWRGHIRSIVDLARTNNFNATVLEKSAARSWTELEVFLGSADANVDENRLETLLAEAIVALRANTVDTTDKTKKYTDQLQLSLNTLQKNGYLQWHEWAKISKDAPGAKSKDLIEDLNEFTKKASQHPNLQAHIKEYIFSIFSIAGHALTEYDHYKKVRGLMDYTDMEVLVTGLLDLPKVQAALREELDLLMVDEFQDTSPIQLQLFIKMAKCARVGSIWVGDPKQSIYGFRGAEPQLMAAVVEACGGVHEENILKHSYRSREDLVHLSNAIFSACFQDLPENQIVLEPIRTKAQEPEGQSTAFHHWFVEKDDKKVSNIEWFQRAIAEELKLFIEAGHLVLPKGSKSLRPVQGGDVCILCDTNTHCQDMARALTENGLKASVANSGLLMQQEVKLLSACLKYILQPNDALAIAEIQVLSRQLSLEDILNDRIDYLLAETKEAPWQAGHPVMKQLEDIRLKTKEFSSSELVTMVMNLMDIRRWVASWSLPVQRFANLEAIQQLSLKYENDCNRLHEAASLSGFLLWLNQLRLDDKDQQGIGTDADTIHVMTYHRSKGLEFPVVVCHSLEKSLKDSVWGVQLASDATVLDTNDVLKDRWIRFWVQPFADQIGRTELETSITDSPQQQEATKRALEEEARLMYVGLTRARDYLILPTRGKRDPVWINRVCNGDERKNIFVEGVQESPFSWKQQLIPWATKTETYEDNWEISPPALSTSSFWQTSKGQAKDIKAALVSELDPLFLQKQLQATNVTKWALSDLELDTVDPHDHSIYLNLLHALILAGDTWLGSTEAVAIIENYVEAHPWVQLPETSSILNWLVSFWDIWRKLYPQTQFITQHPLQVTTNEGQQWYGSADVSWKYEGQQHYMWILSDINARTNQHLQPSYLVTASANTTVQTHLFVLINSENHALTFKPSLFIHP